MNFIKKIFPLLLLIGIISSCKKYPDGPAFTLLPKKVRLANTWKIGTGYINGVNKTTDFNATYQDFTCMITRTGSYSLSYYLFGSINYSETGTWSWSSNKKHVYFSGTVTSNAAPSSHKYEILKLKDQQLWAKETQNNGDVWEIHFIPR